MMENEDHGNRNNINININSNNNNNNNHKLNKRNKIAKPKQVKNGRNLRPKRTEDIKE